jgi:hypothetical protein
MRDIRVSADVEALVGAATILRLHQNAFTRYGCCSCGMPGSTDEDPTTVVVARYRSGMSQVRFAHARCADSQILEVDTEVPEELSGAMEMRAIAAVLSFPSAPAIRPLLLIEPLNDANARAESGGQVNLFLSSMLDAGLTMVRTGEELPGWAEGWELHLHGPGAATLRSAGGATVYEGGFEQPEPWRKLVLGASSCVVLLGQIGLYAVPGDEMTFTRLTSLIDSAAQTAELVGGIVMVREVGTLSPASTHTRASMKACSGRGLTCRLSGAAVAAVRSQHKVPTEIF